MRTPPTNDELVRGIDALNGLACRTQRQMLRLLSEADRRGLWEGSGAHGMVHFVSIRYGISWWKAERWVHAAHALEHLPLLSRALEQGELSIDKVVELARFATPETEAGLIRWAEGVSSGAIRRRGDLEVRRSREEAEQVDRDRTLSWWYFDEGRRFALEAELPAAEGAVVARAIERLACRLPKMPDEHGSYHAEARRADALVVLASATVAADPDPDRATVVIHASAEALCSDERSCQVEAGGLAPAETVRRLACSGRLQVVLEDEGGTRWAWPGPHAIPRRRSCANSRTGIRSVGSRVVDRGGSPRLTTSDGGAGAAAPTWTTWCSSARSTTSWCTNTGGA